MNPKLRTPEAAAGYFSDDDDGKTGTRVFDSRYKAFMVRVLPGDYYVTGSGDEVVVTVLGSCVAACIRNPFTGFGGLNHFMLPHSTSGDWNGTSSALRYGNFAMEALINEVLKSGCRRADLEIKLFGGANLMIGPSMVGPKNGAFARDYLTAEGLKITAADLGGPYGRRIHYTPSTGKVSRLLLQDNAEKKIAEAEAKYGNILTRKSIEGEIELFDV